MLFFGIVAFPADTWAETFTVGSLNYETNADGDNTVTVTGHVGDTNPTGTLTIPGNVDYGGITYTVTQIGEGAFSSCIGFTGSLTIGTSVETIGNNAFDSCIGLTGSLTIPNSVKTIGANASVSAQATITVIDDSIDVSTTPVDQSTADARDM